MSIDVLTLGPEALPGFTDQPVVICTRKARIVSSPANTRVLVYSGRALLVGAILRAGAAEAIMRIADTGESGAGNTALLTDDAPSPRTATFNGYVGQTIVMDRGITAQIDQIDAVGWILFAPF